VTEPFPPSDIGASGNEAARTEPNVLLPGQTPEGQYILSLLVKRTYDIQPGRPCVRAEEDKKLVPGDEHFGDPMNSTVAFETDFIPYKPATDVVFNGSAYAPGGRPVQSLRTALQVGAHRKEVQVMGDRVCQYQPRGFPAVTGPEPFTVMEMRYERAYGGFDIYSDPQLPCAYPRNHLGKGFVLRNTPDSVNNLELPNLENPNDPLSQSRLFVEEIRHWERQPMPQSFGWFGKSWYPRAQRAGVMPADREVEQELRKAYAAALPPEQRKMYEEHGLPDMDFCFFNGASPGLAVPFLCGDEEVRLENLVPEGLLTFHLPGERPQVGLDFGLELREPEVFLHTVQIRIDEQRRQVDLVWRAAAEYPGPDWLPEMKKLEILIR